MKSWFFSLLSAALVVTGSGHLAAQEETLKIVTSPLDAGFEVYYAQSQGFFKNAGLNVQISEQASGAASAAAVVAGDQNIGLSNILSLAQAHAHGVPLVMVAPGGAYSSKAPTAGLVVLVGGPIHSAHDLNGKIIAVNGLKSISQIGPQAWIDRNDGDSSTVKFVEVQQSVVPSALSAGRIDAALLNEPDLSSMMLSNNYRNLAPVYDEIAKSFLINGWFTTLEWANAHRELVRKFDLAMQETARWANTHQKETEEILRQHTKATIVPGMKRAVFQERFDPVSAQPLIDIAARYHMIEAAFPASQIIFSPPNR